MQFQIAATEGTISGDQIQISSTTRVAGNEDAAKRFGLRTNVTFPTRTLSSSSITLSNKGSDYPKTLVTTLNGVSINVTLSFDGTNYSLNSSNTALSAVFSDTLSGNNNKCLQ